MFKLILYSVTRWHHLRARIWATMLDALSGVRRELFFAINRPWRFCKMCHKMVLPLDLQRKSIGLYQMPVSWSRECAVWWRAFSCFSRAQQCNKTMTIQFNGERKTLANIYPVSISIYHIILSWILVLMAAFTWRKSRTMYCLLTSWKSHWVCVRRLTTHFP